MHSGQNDYEIDALSTGPFAPPFAHPGAHGKRVFVYEVNASILYHLNPLCDGLMMPKL